MWLIPLTEESSPEERWEWFMQRFTPDMKRALYAEIYKVLENPADVDDVMQEAMLQGAMHCHQLRDEDRLFQWMFSVVRRLALRHKNKSTKVLLQKLRVFCSVTPPRGTPDDYILRTDERKRLLAAIARLKSPGREIMKLKSEGEWNLRVIAEQLNLNYHTTRSLYQRARRELIRELEDYYYEER